MLKERISYIKPGMAVGGATMADIELFRIFKVLGKEIHINTGFVDKRIQLSLQHDGFEVTVNPLYDRYHKFNSIAEGSADVDKLFSEEFKRSNLTIISQSFLGDADVFNNALSSSLNHGYTGQTWLRSHDHIRDKKNFEKIGERPLCLPTTRALENHMNVLNPNSQTFVLPYYIDRTRFNKQLEEHSAKETRDHLGLSKNDFIIFQPSRVDPRKRIGKSVYLASELQKRLGNRKVVLLVAGGAEPIKAHKEERKRLTKLAQDNGFYNLVFLNGLSGDGQFRRVTDYIRPGVANLVTFMSEIDAFGIPPLECSMAGVPCVTSSFQDELGYSAFDYNYGNHGFSFVLDDDPENFVSEDTLQKAVLFAKNPSLFDNNLSNNRRLAEEKYCEESMKKILLSLLISSGVI